MLSIQDCNYYYKYNAKVGKLPTKLKIYFNGLNNDELVAYNHRLQSTICGYIGCLKTVDTMPIGTPDNYEKKEKYWIIAENGTDIPYYYRGFYEDGLPVFSMAIADAVHIASFVNAKGVFAKLNKVCPCEIILVDNGKITQVYPPPLS